MTTTTEAPIVRGAGYRLSTNVALADNAAGALLSTTLQDRARRYVAARRRSGDALIEAVAELAAARSEAEHGEWGTFLEAIGLDDATARAQIRIHEAAVADPGFADRLRTGWLTLTTARELLPAPPDVRDRLLSQDAPPTAQQIREAKRVLTPVLGQPNIPEVEPPARTLDTSPLADAQARFAALGWSLQRRDDHYVLTRPDGAHYATTPDLAPQLATLARFESGAMRSEGNAPTPPHPHTPTPDAVPHLPPDFTDAQRRAETIGLMLSMDMEGRFAVRDPATGVGLVGFWAWTAVLAHLGKMEAAAAKRDRIVALVAAERESDAHVDEIKRLCAISGSRYIGVATDRGVADGTRYRIALFGGGGGDYLADEAVATLRAICDRRASAAAPPAPILPTPAVDWLNQVAPLTDLVTELCEAADWSDRAGVIRAALRLASAAAGDRLEDLAEQLDDAEYEALAAYRRERRALEIADSR